MTQRNSVHLKKEQTVNIYANKTLVAIISYTEHGNVTVATVQPIVN